MVILPVFNENLILIENSEKVYEYEKFVEKFDGILNYSITKCENVSTPIFFPDGIDLWVEGNEIYFELVGFDVVKKRSYPYDMELEGSHSGRGTYSLDVLLLMESNKLVISIT